MSSRPVLAARNASCSTPHRKLDELRVDHDRGLISDVEII